MPKVTVIIPTFNRERFIRECVESVLSQTYQDFELIVVDDGSTDGTPDLLQKYDGRLTYIWQENRGPSAARNRGIQLASGEWICFLDSDDLWLPRKLERQMEFFARHPDARVCYTEEIWYRYGRRVNPKKKHRKYSGWIYQKMLPLCLVSPSSVMLHRSVFDVVGLFDEDLPACEDYDLWLRVGARYPIYLLTEPLIIKRNGHEGQQSQKFWGMDRFRIRALVKMLESGVLNEEDYRATQEMLRQKCEIVAGGSEKRGKLQEAEHYRNLIRTYCGETA
jgi:glycosyltransferase involved in cell wall biosynthesis